MKNLIVLFVLISANLFAQNKAYITVKSTAPQTQEFRIVTFKEPIIAEEIPLGNIKLNNKIGSSEIEFNSNIIPILIFSSNAEIELYVAANDTVILNYNGLDLEIININILNKSIQDINMACNNFFFRASKREGAPLPAKQTRAFCDSMLLHFKDTNTVYIKEYLKYKIAYVEISANARSRKDASKKYFSDNQLQFTNLAWKDAFSTLYKGYFIQYKNSKKGEQLNALISNKKGYTDLLAEFSKDSVIFSTEIKKLVFLQGLNELFQVKQPEKKYLLSLLLEAKMLEKSPEIVSSIDAIILHYSKFDVGNKPAELTLIDARNKNEINLSKLNGKAIYFCYYPLFNQLTQQEIIFLKGIYKKYQAKIEFIVVADADESTIEAVAKNLALPFPIASASSANANISSWLERKDVINYMLIDSNGKIYQAPAEGPETGVEAAFLGLIK